LTDYITLKHFPDDSVVTLTITMQSSTSPLVGTGTTRWDDDR
jgi:hypothetical protein